MPFLPRLDPRSNRSTWQLRVWDGLLHWSLFVRVMIWWPAVDLEYVGHVAPLGVACKSATTACYHNYEFSGEALSRWIWLLVAERCKYSCCSREYASSSCSLRHLNYSCVVGRWMLMLAHACCSTQSFLLGTGCSLLSLVRLPNFFTATETMLILLDGLLDGLIYVNIIRKCHWCESVETRFFRFCGRTTSFFTDWFWKSTMADVVHIMLR